MHRRTTNNNSPILLFHLVHYLPMSNQEKLNEYTSKAKVRNRQLAAIAKQAKKAGGFQQAFAGTAIVCIGMRFIVYCPKIDK